MKNNNHSICISIFRLFTKKCERCGIKLEGKDLVLKTDETRYYHYDCFCCHVCNKRILPGDEYGSRDELLFCKEDANIILTTTTNTNNKNQFISNYQTSTISITSDYSTSSCSPSSNSSSSSSIVTSPANYGSRNNLSTSLSVLANSNNCMTNIYATPPTSNSTFLFNNDSYHRLGNADKDGKF
jgi:hypothetical protein